MNLLRLSFLLVIIVALSSCKKDDDGSSACVQADWLGTYTGVQTCSGVTDSVTVTIAASGANAVLISYEDLEGFLSTEYDAMTPDGCSAELNNTVAGTGFIFEADLSGDNVTLREITDVPIIGRTTICTVTATRN